MEIIKNIGIGDALKYLMDGYKIRRESFLEGTYWILFNGREIKVINKEGQIEICNLNFIYPINVNDWCVDNGQ